MTPLAIDLFCGLGGWTDGLLAEGFDVIGFDIERHVYGEHRYPAQLVIQDITTLHGSQFKTADLIVASPPCQAYSWRAMPWKKAKAAPAPDNTLFETCFRLQREACEAAGRRVPLIVENVKGAQKWVGRARWNYGSYYLWGDVPALMPITLAKRMKSPAHCGPRMWKDREYVRLADGNPSGFHHEGAVLAAETGYKSAGMNWSDRTKRGQDFTRVAGDQAFKNAGGSWFQVAHNTTSGRGQNPDGRLWQRDPMAATRGTKRKAASALIAKIPLPLSRHIARTFRGSAS